MFNRGIFCKFVFVILIALAIVFSGCGDPDRSSGGPGTDHSSGTWKVGRKNADTEAVKLYVDAMMLNEIKEWDEAIKKLNAAVEHAPEFSLAYSFKGDIYQLTKQYEVSADSYDQATRIDPWSFKDFANLGKVCQIIENFTRAVKAYVSACEIKTDNFDVHLGAGRCFYELDNFDLAFGYCQRAKEIDPNTGNVDVLLGDIHIAKSDAYLLDKQDDAAKASLAKAVASYKRALEIDGNKPDTMVSLAVVYTRQENFDFAEELLHSAIEKDPNSSTAFQYLGFVQLNLHKEDLSLAMNSYNKAVEIDGNDWMAHKGLGVVYMLKFLIVRDKAEKQNTLDNLDKTFKLKAMENWDVSLTIKPDQPHLKKLYEECTSN
ncbi:MAG: tetratricopeptide repeat protein [Planctomycetes bacterium]|nr:tetratricopeptide repeat protein [Planctomycetota bacterium]